MWKVEQKRSGPLEFMPIAQAGIVLLYGNGGSKAKCSLKKLCAFLKERQFN